MGGDSVNVICFGDSNTYGYDPRSWLGERYEPDSRWVDLLAAKTGWIILNEGMNGREIPKENVHFPEDTDLLIIMLGSNDLLMGRSPEEAADRMGRFLENTGVPFEKILIIAPPAMVRGAWIPEDRLIKASMALAESYRSLSERLGVRFVDSGNWNVPLCYDGVHLTQEGHRIFADRLYRELMK